MHALAVGIGIFQCGCVFGLCDAEDDRIPGRCDRFAFHICCCWLASSKAHILLLDDTYCLELILVVGGPSSCGWVGVVFDDQRDDRLDLSELTDKGLLKVFCCVPGQSGHRRLFGIRYPVVVQVSYGAAAT